MTFIYCARNVRSSNFNIRYKSSQQLTHVTKKLLFPHMHIIYVSSAIPYDNVPDTMKLD